jgi:endonuclease III related protein
MAESLTTALLDVYARLHQHYGYEAHWWPLFTANWRWETMLGAVLVQQSQWERVEQAIMRLDALDLVDERALAVAPTPTITEAIRPVAYYNAKAPAIQRLAQYIVDHYDGDTAALFRQPTGAARRELLRLGHVGPETADAMLVYAGQHASFVVDASLRRFFGRLGIIPNIETMPYEQLRILIEAALPVGLDLSAYSHLDQELHPEPGAAPRPTNDEERRARFFWDYHALIIEHGIHHCLSRRPRCDETSAPRRGFAQPIKCATHCPPCDGCPLRVRCMFYQTKGAA